MTSSTEEGLRPDDEGGVEGVKYSRNFDDVIYGRSKTYTLYRQSTIILYYFYYSSIIFIVVLQ